MCHSRTVMVFHTPCRMVSEHVFGQGCWKFLPLNPWQVGSDSSVLTKSGLNRGAQSQLHSLQGLGREESEGKSTWSQCVYSSIPQCINLTRKNNPGQFLFYLRA